MPWWACGPFSNENGQISVSHQNPCFLSAFWVDCHCFFCDSHESAHVAIIGESRDYCAFNWSPQNGVHVTFIMVPQLLLDRYFYFICDKSISHALSCVRMGISHGADTLAKQISHGNFPHEIPMGNLNFSWEIPLCVDTPMEPMLFISKKQQLLVHKGHFGQDAAIDRNTAQMTAMASFLG